MLNDLLQRPPFDLPSTTHLPVDKPLLRLTQPPTGHLIRIRARPVQQVPSLLVLDPFHMVLDPSHRVLDVPMVRLLHSLHPMVHIPPSLHPFRTHKDPIPPQQAHAEVMLDLSRLLLLMAQVAETVTSRVSFPIACLMGVCPPAIPKLIAPYRAHRIDRSTELVPPLAHLTDPLMVLARCLAHLARHHLTIPDLSLAHLVGHHSVTHVPYQAQ